MNSESLKRQVQFQNQTQNMSYQNGFANQYPCTSPYGLGLQPPFPYQPGLGQQMLSQSMLMTPVNPPPKESPKMTNQTLEHLKQVVADTTASTAARDAANLLVAREEAALAEKKAALQAEAKKALELLFTEGREVRESELITMAKRAGVKFLKATSAGPKEKVRLVSDHRNEEIRELLMEGWTIGRTLNPGYFEMLAPAPAEKPRARAKK